MAAKTIRRLLWTPKRLLRMQNWQTSRAMWQASQQAFCAQANARHKIAMAVAKGMQPVQYNIQGVGFDWTTMQTLLES